MLRAGALLGLRRAASSAPRASHARRARCVSASVSGPRYAAAAEGAPRVTLYTKEGCTLCDKAAEVLAAVRGEADHALEAVDITDDGNERWHGMYKYDIPVLHIDGAFWAKHRLTETEAREALAEAQAGRFEARAGEPDAERLERRAQGKE